MTDDTTQQCGRCYRTLPEVNFMVGDKVFRTCDRCRERKRNLKSTGRRIKKGRDGRGPQPYEFFDRTGWLSKKLTGES